MQNRFGTTKDMVIQPVEDGGMSYLLAIDSKGLYFTSSKYLDSMLADPNRYAVDRNYTVERLLALGMDPVKIAVENKKLVKTDSGASAKKVNPLKASKRGMGK